MKRRFPLIALVAILAIGMWVALGQTATTPPKGAAIGSPMGINTGGIAFAGGIPETSGVENIYIMEHKTGSYDNEEDLQEHENILEFEGTDAVITASGGPAVEIPYENAFDIVIAVKIDSENVAYLEEESVKLEFATSGHFTITAENSTDAMEWTFATEGSENLYLNIIWDNNGNGYTLGANTTLNIDTAKLWLWK